MSGQTQRAFCLCFMHAAATFYIAHIFFINCKFRSEPRGIHELAVQCALPWDRGLGQNIEGERGGRGSWGTNAATASTEGSVAVPSGQRTRPRRWRWRRQSVVKMNMRILAAEILNIRRVCRIANRKRMAWCGLSHRNKRTNRCFSLLTFQETYHVKSYHQNWQKKERTCRFMH